MTAVVGILNKQGIAIAADSAVTVKGVGHRKIYNYANKIFALSKHHPVAVAVYNNAQFMGVPWEILIKEYRKKIGLQSFSTLEEYKNDFFEWLKEKDYFVEKSEENHLMVDFVNFLHAFIQTIIRQKNIGINKIKTDISTHLDKYISEEIPKHKPNKQLASVNEAAVASKLRSLAPRVIKTINHQYQDDLLKTDITELLTKAYLAYLKHDQFVDYSGLVFTGYGDDEIFPRLLTVNVSIVVDGHLRFMEDISKKAAIGEKVFACIMPFAQIDVIDTILSGINPELFKLSNHVLDNLLREILTVTLPNIEGMPKQVIDQLNQIDVGGIVNKYQSSVKNIINEKHVHPLMNAVSQLSKEDLAEMSESLVYMTYLKRRFSMGEESVGGPVDVAIITKGDGFIWIKRKHYFDPGINQNYFQNYF